MNGEDENNKETRNTRTIGELKRSVGTDSIEDVVGFVLDLAKKQGYGEKRIEEMDKTFRELFGNVVIYAFQGSQGAVEIYCTLDRADRMVFKIIDAGAPFNMLLAGDPLFAEEYADQGLAQPSSKLVKRFCETVEYQRLDNRNYLFVTFSKAVKSKT